MICQVFMDYSGDRLVVLYNCDASVSSVGCIRCFGVATLLPSLASVADFAGHFGLYRRGVYVFNFVETRPGNPQVAQSDGRGVVGD